MNPQTHTKCTSYDTNKLDFDTYPQTLHWIKAKMEGNCNVTFPPILLFESQCIHPLKSETSKKILSPDVISRQGNSSGGKKKVHHQLWALAEIYENDGAGV